MSSVDSLARILHNIYFLLPFIIWFGVGARERKHPVLTVPVCGVKSLESKDGSKNFSTTIDCLTTQIKWAINNLIYLLCVK